MKGYLYYAGKAFQILGMGTVVVAFISFFAEPLKGDMFKLTFLGLIEFYIGYLVVAYTGQKVEEERNDG